MSARPFKVWNYDRTIKKSVTAATLAELINKGKQKLQIQENNVRILLQEDGTEVDEEDYFTFLPHNTIFLLLHGAEQWRPEGADVCASDETDSSLSAIPPVAQRLGNLLSGLQKDISRIITFSNDDLQTIIEMDTGQLSSLLQETETLSNAIQESCQRHLDDRKQATEAIDLLRLYDTARKNSPFIGDETRSKKPRLSKTTH